MEGGPEIIEEEYERDEVQQTESKREKGRERERERSPRLCGEIALLERAHLDGENNAYPAEKIGNTHIPMSL